MADIRFLVLGASGLVGRRLLRRLGPERAVGTYHSRPFPGGIRFDLTRDRLGELLAHAGGRFSHAVVASGITRIDACAADPDGSARVNVEGVARLLDDLIAAGIHPIFTSSDGVYDGSRPLSREDDPTAPILTYGRHKLAIERHLAQRDEPWTVVRLSKVLDPALDPDGVLGPWIDDLVHGRPIRCAVDQVFTPVGVDDVVEALRRLAAAGLSGLFNLGGPERLSRMELLERLLAEVRRHRDVAPVIQACSIRDFPFAEPRPFDGSQCIDKLRAAIGYDPEGMTALCRRAAATYFGRS